MTFNVKGLVDNNPAFGVYNDLAPNRRQAIIWTIADLMYWLIHEALGGTSKSIKRTYMMILIVILRWQLIFHVGFCNIIDVLHGNV